jgi:ribosomal-protein-alanine N-acetyltransferase
VSAAVPVEEATAGDLPAIAALEVTCLGDDAWSEGLLAEGVTGGLPTISYLVARGPAGVVGHAVASYAGDVAELQRITVDPAERRQGIATALLDAVVARAARAGADGLLLEVREDNDVALAFYAARGFGEVDRRRRYYRDGATAVVLRRSLRPGRGDGSRGSDGPDDPGLAGKKRDKPDRTP